MTRDRRFDRHLPRPAPAMPLGERLSLWRRVLDGYAQAAREVIEAGGDRLSLTPDLRHDLALTARAVFPVEGVCPTQAAEGFRLFAGAMGLAEIPARRAALAAGVLGAVEALDGLIHAEQVRLTDVRHQRLGAGV